MARTKPKTSKNGGRKGPLKQLSDKAIGESAPAEPKTEDDGKNGVDKEEQENVAEEVKTTDAGVTVTTEAKAVKRSHPARGNVKTQKKSKVETEKDDEEEKAEEEPKEPCSETPSTKPRKSRKKKNKAQQQTPKAGVVTQVEKKKAISPAASKPKTQQSKKKIKS